MNRAHYESRRLSVRVHRTPNSSCSLFDCSGCSNCSANSKNFIIWRAARIANKPNSEQDRTPQSVKIFEISEQGLKLYCSDFGGHCLYAGCLSPARGFQTKWPSGRCACLQLTKCLIFRGTFSQSICVGSIRGTSLVNMHTAEIITAEKNFKLERLS